MKTSQFAITTWLSVFTVQLLFPCAIAQATQPKPTPAKSGYDNLSASSEADAKKNYEEDKDTFDETELIGGNGLGPVYNAQSCRECHQSPVSGAASQITEHRAGHIGKSGEFETPDVKLVGGEIVGRSLINDRAICAAAQERVPETETIQTNRLSLNILGDGYVEALSDNTILDIRKKQCSPGGRFPRICGVAIYVPILEDLKNHSQRIGRFGWKDQHASLLSFAADAYINEMGVTNRLIPTEFTMICNPKITTSKKETDQKGSTVVTEPNDLPDEDTKMDDLDHFARFMRNTTAPPRDLQRAGGAEAIRGEKLFTQIGCNECHVPTLVTAPEGSKLNGGLYQVPSALANKIISPYSDFLLHDVGTGDGIAIAPPEHYGPFVAAYLSAQDDKRLAQQDAEAFGLEKGHPLDIETILNKPLFAKLTAPTNKLVKLLVDNIACDSRKVSNGALDGTSYIFYHGIQCSANKVRTPPLWGVRIRTRLMHDGASLQFKDAILRHKNEAEEVTKNFEALSDTDRQDIYAFLQSL